MNVATIVLSEKVPAELRTEVEDRLAYASKDLVSFALAEDGTSVDVEVRAEHHEVVVQKVQDLVRTMVKGHRAAPAEVLFTHRVRDKRGDAAGQSRVWEALVAKGLVIAEDHGLIALYGDACRLAEALDRLFAEIGTSVFGATPHQYPTMIPLAVLNRCEYFSSFPHHVTFAPHMREDYSAIADFAKTQAAGDPNAFSKNLATPKHALSPAVCFHTYALLANQTLASSSIVTARGRCFRYESKNIQTLERLWDFTMREVIFVGPRTWVDEQRARCIEEVKALIGALGLDAWIETANDPFFATAFVAKRYHQLMTRAKYELRLGLPDADPNRSVAAASFNVHGDFFGRSFGITSGGESACTGCLAFGIERWVWALYSQLGPDMAIWPAPVRERLGI